MSYVKLLKMEYLNIIGSHYAGLFTLLGSSVGLIGFLFGLWRYYKERSARQQLERTQNELDQALSRLKLLEDYASGIKQYSATV